VVVVQWMFGGCSVVVRWLLGGHRCLCFVWSLFGFGLVFVLMVAWRLHGVRLVLVLWLVCCCFLVVLLLFHCYLVCDFGDCQVFDWWHGGFLVVVWWIFGGCLLFAGRIQRLFLFACSLVGRWCVTVSSCSLVVFRGWLLVVLWLVGGWLVDVLMIV